jgi:hypothetical protein
LGDSFVCKVVSTAKLRLVPKWPDRGSALDRFAYDADLPRTWAELPATAPGNAGDVGSVFMRTREEEFCKMLARGVFRRFAYTFFV